MTDFIRRLVSLDKARYKDDELDIDLDLVYITEQVIIMGYPASGLEALYRNRREDAKRFLEHRHGKNFWIFNFCPVAENFYPSSVFDGRVSRYPFPDHHAPPLAILPLVAREIREWLTPSKERVAVLHCKAGKGRSGTMACAYLLTSDEAPSPQTMRRSQTARDEATSRAQQIMDAMPSDDPSQEPPQTEPGTPVPLDVPGHSVGGSNKQQERVVRGDHAENLSRVLELHTSKRMKRPSSPSQKPKQGVSIPSQRRWLYYWSLIISHQAPQGFWSRDKKALKRPSPKVRLTRITVRMHELSGVKVNLMRAANALLERTSYAKAPSDEIAPASRAGGRVWVSLARYDDELVDTLERWERQTRDDEGNIGRRKPGSEHMGDEALSDVFKDDKWDKRKMVRPFARLGVVCEDDYLKEDTQTDGNVMTRVLRPLTDDKWGKLRDRIREHAAMDLQEDKKALPNVVQDEHVESEDTSINDVTQTLKDDQGVVLNADREVRVKLYMGQVFLGWFWFIPTFHMPHPSSPAGQSATLVLKRKELDFPIGIGSNIIEVTVSMDWVPQKANVLDPPSREGSLASRQGCAEPAAVFASSLQAAGDPIAGVVDTKQAAED